MVGTKVEERKVKKGVGAKKKSKRVKGGERRGASFAPDKWKSARSNLKGEVGG